MDVAKPKGMYQRGAVWWARKDVPKELRQIIGRTSLKRTLGTSDIEIAKIAFYGVMQGFEATITKARKQLAGQGPSDVIISIPMEPQWAEALMHLERRKPENQIRDMLEKSKLIAEKRTGPKLGELFKQWAKERQPTSNTQEEYERSKRLFIELNGDLPITE
jgi:hypothetical protein